MRSIRISSNMSSLDKFRMPGQPFEHRMLSNDMSMRGVLRDYLAARNDDFILLSTDAHRSARFGLLSFFIPRRAKLVSMDILLSRPQTFRARLQAMLKRLLLSRVDHFLVLQRDLEGYEKYYGISHGRSTFIPFKVNGWKELQTNPPEVHDGGYFLQAGRTYRDLPLFAKAAGIAGIDGMLVRQPADVLRVHGTRVDELLLPPNVREVIDDGPHAGLIKKILGARAVCVALQPGVLAPAGISTVLDAMAFGKCVIVTRSPTTEGVIPDDAAVIVPPGDAEALAAAMRRVNDDAGFRERVAAAAKRFALTLGGEERLLTDVVNALARLAPAR